MQDRHTLNDSTLCMTITTRQAFSMMYLKNRKS